MILIYIIHGEAIFLRDVRCREIVDEKVIAVVEVEGGRDKEVGSRPSNI
jgi:hypothetical protein